ncbi:hypothetical protein GN244_ATG09611 [Phytophthora infestans]|uniref:Rab-GAP TBC domain-containing protein n=1 Tax=Phytophthora infestans TaxID=4787 RepID=A0A833T7L1_PHYIN|nr:hypothetical protein GN244_ATG09611 [Phytophthora infestans]KAF4127902.1 hypothetical protein GN958_ATG22904 [Phytophthora infestans]
MFQTIEPSTAANLARNLFMSPPTVGLAYNAAEPTTSDGSAIWLVVTATRHANGSARTESEHRSDIFLMTEIEKDVFRTRCELPLFAGGGSAQHATATDAVHHLCLCQAAFGRGYAQGMDLILARTTASASEVETDAYHIFVSKTLLAAITSNLQVGASRAICSLQMARLAKLLRQHDAALWQHLVRDSSPREFSIPDTLLIWDALLADPKRFSFLRCVNCALIRSQRSFLRFTKGFKRLQTLQASSKDLSIYQIAEVDM